ncbi:MAG: UbiA family prenyltransferase [Bacteroidia bacterium]
MILQFDKNTIKLLRIPFSFFLMPVFLFALASINSIHLVNAFIAFVALHLFIYPASNGYNSYMDNDTESIGGLKNPPMPTKNLFYVSFLFDIIGLVLCSFISFGFAALIMLYILASRAYSFKGIRLKKYPFISWITVSFFQGSYLFLVLFFCLSNNFKLEQFPTVLFFVPSLLIGATYPLSQIYQHQQDKASGDITLSILLGYKGTFIFSATLFIIATILFFIQTEFLTLNFLHFYWFQAFLFPVVAYFLWWAYQVFKNSQHANFQNTMRMNMLSSLMLTIYFTLEIIIKNWYK